METNRQRKSKSARKPNENNEPTADAFHQTNVKAKKPPPPPTSSALQTIVPAPLRKPSLSRKNAGSNWSNVLASVNATENDDVSPPSDPTSEANSHDHPTANGKTDTTTPTAAKKSRSRRKKQQRTVVVAMDCEMVGTGPLGNDDMLARVSIVSKNGEVLLDKFVKPREPVTNYRTSVSGIRARDIEHADEFDKVQDEVIELLQGKILVGHGIRNDLAVLFIKHPYVNIRDTSTYKPLARLVSNGRTPSLKRLSQAILGLEIQKGEHNSVEDARAAMSIYNRLSADWEKYIQSKNRSR